MSSERDKILELGRHVADALDPGDVVGRWMSHHLAELITQCEAAPDDKELATETRGIILQLWEHKQGASFRRRPFEYLTPALKAIARLEPKPQPWAHYQPFADRVEPPASELSRYSILGALCDIDRSVGKLVRVGVAAVATEALAREEPWAVAASAISESEEDKAVRALEDLVQRVRAAATAMEPLEGQDGLDAGGGFDDLRDRVVSVADDDAAPPTDAVAEALRSTVVECKVALDELAQLLDESITQTGA